jgi:hypothetical protein
MGPNGLDPLGCGLGLLSGDPHDTGRQLTGRTALVTPATWVEHPGVPDPAAPGRPSGPEWLPWPRFQEMTADWLELGQRRHAAYALLEVDVTRARSAIRARRARTGRPLGFNAYLVACFARAIAADPRIGALRHGRRRLLVPPTVDVAFPVEHEVEGWDIPVPHIIRAADRRSLESIDRAVAGGAVSSPPYARGRRLLPLWLLLPGWLRRGFMARYLANAHRRRRLTGTTLVTAVGLPSRGSAWGLPGGTHYPVSLVIGGLRKGDDGRECVALTLAFDHDTVDGAPAARFVRRFARLIEQGALLDAD